MVSKKMVFSRVLVALLFLYSISLLGQQSKLELIVVPDWLEASGRENLYPSNVYLRGFSAGILTEYDSIEGLLNRLSSLARKELLESIRVDIKNTATYSIFEDEKSTKNSYKVISESSSNFDISSIKIEKHFDKSTRMAFAFAYAKKNDVIKFYSNLISLKESELLNKVAEGDYYFKKNDNQNALKVYSKALVVFKEIEKHQVMLVSLGLDMEKQNKENSIVLNLKNQIRKKINMITQKEQILVLSKSTSKSARYNEPIFESLKVTVFFSRNKISDPRKLKFTAANVPVTFFQDTFIHCSTFTNDKGEAYCMVEKITKKDRFQIIKVNVDLSKYLGIDKSCIGSDEIFNSISVPAKFNIEVVPLSFFVNATESSYDKPVFKSGVGSVIEPKIKNYISDLGFGLSNNQKESDYVINVITTTVQVKDAGADNFDFASVFLNATINIFDNRKRENIYSNSYTNVKGISTSTERAYNSANNKVCDYIKKDIEKLYSFKAIN